MSLSLERNLHQTDSRFLNRNPKSQERMKRYNPDPKRKTNNNNNKEIIPANPEYFTQ